MKVKQIVGKQLFWPSRFGIGTRPEKVLPDSNSSWTDLDPGVTFTKIFKIILKFLSHRRPQSPEGGDGGIGPPEFQKLHFLGVMGF